jgi:hypothetical protein
MAKAFAARYLLTNFWKSAAALQQAGNLIGGRPRDVVRIVDLGSGSGAASLAVLAHLDEQLSSRTTVELVLVDDRGQQLSMAETLIDAAATALPGLSVDARTETRHLAADTDLMAVLSGATLVLASHVLTETRDEARALLSSVLAQAPAGCTTMIFERRDDPVWDQVSEAISASALPARGGEIMVPALGLALNGHAASRADHQRLPVRWVAVITPFSSARWYERTSTHGAVSQSMRWTRSFQNNRRIMRDRFRSRS